MSNIQELKTLRLKRVQ